MEPSVGDEVAVEGDHADAVAVVPLEVRVDEMVGDDAGFFSGAPGGKEPLIGSGAEFSGTVAHLGVPPQGVQCSSIFF